MKCGIIALGVYSFLDAIVILFKMIHYIKIAPVVGIFFGVAMISELINLYYFARYFHKDNYLTRLNLPKGCKFMIFANIVCYIGTVFGIFHYKKDFYDR